MTHTALFVQADQCIAHLDTFVPGLSDPVLRSQYTGFAAVSAVTVFELAVKAIFIEFASKKHSVFGSFTGAHFDRLNGRITLGDLRKQHVPRFGERYSKRFDRLLKECEDRELRSTRASVKSSYGNLVTWRHEFAHEGRVPTHATFDEVRKSYELGKKVIECLALAMTR